MNEWQHLFRMMKPYRWRVALSILISAFTIGANIGLFGVSGHLIASAALHPANVLLLWIPIVGVRFFGISRAVFRYLERLISHDVTFRILSDLRVKVFRQQANLGPQIWQTKHHADALSNVISDVEQVQYFYLRLFSPVMIAILTGLFGCYWFALFDVSMAIGFGLIYLFAGILIPLLFAFAGQRHGKTLVQARAKWYQQTSNWLHALIHWQLAGRSAEKQAEINQTQAHFSNAQHAMNTFSALSNTIIFLCSRFTMLFIFIQAVPLLQKGLLQGVELPMLMLIGLACFEAITPLPAAFQQWSATRESAQRLLKTSEIEQLNHHSLKLQSLDQHHIQLHDVSLRHPEQIRPSLYPTSLEIAKGEHLAIVGESGAGKSTLLKIIMGDLTPTTGQLLINRHSFEMIGHLFGDEAMETYRSKITFVPQNVYLFRATVAENIRLGKPNATLQEIEDAARKAQIHERILQMPNGYDTFISELGTNLSGGERQRIGLARAILRDAKLYLFDEPLNGLDHDTAEAFVKTVQDVLHARNVIWVTHRFEGITAFDRMIVMKHGRILATGDHHQLMKQCAYYALLRSYDANFHQQQKREPLSR